MRYLTKVEELSAGNAARFRSAVGSAIYLSADRRDIQFAVKELARRMQAPSVLSVWGLTAVPKTWGNDWVAQAEKAHMLLSFQKPATVGIADSGSGARKSSLDLIRAHRFVQA